jgi:hypothetical protein
MSSPKEKWARWENDEHGAEILNLGFLILKVGYDRGLGRKYVATSNAGGLSKSGFETNTEAKKYAEKWARAALVEATAKIPLYW